MFQGLYSYIRINTNDALCSALNGVCAGLIGNNLASNGMSDLENFIGNLLLSILVCGAIGKTLRDSWNRLGRYGRVDWMVEQEGFSQALFLDKESARLAQLYARENGRMQEYQEALERYRDVRLIDIIKK